MPGRRTFFSFHYQRDIWRASIVRNAGVVDARAAAGWTDASLWEEAKRRGDDAVKRLIDDGLSGTSVTAVLIGAETYTRRWVNYEIQASINCGNGLLGVYIHMLEDRTGRATTRGPVPQLLLQHGIPCYDWDRYQFGRWVELAAARAGR